MRAPPQPQTRDCAPAVVTQVPMLTVRAASPEPRGLMVPWYKSAGASMSGADAHVLLTARRRPYLMPLPHCVPLFKMLLSTPALQLQGGARCVRNERWQVQREQRAWRLRCLFAASPHQP